MFVGLVCEGLEYCSVVYGVDVVVVVGVLDLVVFENFFYVVEFLGWFRIYF